VRKWRFTVDPVNVLVEFLKAEYKIPRTSIVAPVYG